MVQQQSDRAELKEDGTTIIRQSRAKRRWYNNSQIERSQKKMVQQYSDRAELKMTQQQSDRAELKEDGTTIFRYSGAKRR